MTKASATIVQQTRILDLSTCATILPWQVAGGGPAIQDDCSRRLMHRISHRSLYYRTDGHFPSRSNWQFFQQLIFFNAKAVAMWLALINGTTERIEALFQLGQKMIFISRYRYLYIWGGGPLPNCLFTYEDFARVFWLFLRYRLTVRTVLCIVIMHCNMRRHAFHTN
ncbi:hypothetical protein TrispH2_009218 [Trichoplax sp. H2]|nr:hypothetical protein TrispH2_009218 [Trichoplax sp. H2]|eukprot:RDD40160.1 hypothetical protein TrispH2_009218 [Trichoplax sp. H2]